jgi:hypothetical protein
VLLKYCHWWSSGQCLDPFLNIQHDPDRKFYQCNNVFAQGQSKGVVSSKFRGKISRNYRPSHPRPISCMRATSRLRNHLWEWQSNVIFNLDNTFQILAKMLRKEPSLLTVNDLKTVEQSRPSYIFKIFGWATSTLNILRLRLQWQVQINIIFWNFFFYTFPKNLDTSAV